MYSLYYSCSIYRSKYILYTHICIQNCNCVKQMNANVAGFTKTIPLITSTVSRIRIEFRTMHISDTASTRCIFSCVGKLRNSCPPTTPTQPLISQTSHIAPQSIYYARARLPNREQSHCSIRYCTILQTMCTNTRIRVRLYLYSSTCAYHQQ